LNRRQRIAAAIWDNLPFLRLQHAVYALAPRLATHLDDLAQRRDEERRRRRT
jgi:hypothetical protein